MGVCVITNNNRARSIFRHSSVYRRKKRDAAGENTVCPPPPNNNTKCTRYTRAARAMTDGKTSGHVNGWLTARARATGGHRAKGG